MFRRSSRGFTLIELMLAMSFVSILLISIAMLTIQISHLYTRGLTMKEINQAGTEITDDIKRSLASQYPDSIRVASPNGKKVLCTGKYTYIANNPTDIENNNNTNLIKYNANDVARLAKVRDSGGVFCSSLPTQPLDSLGIDAVELLGRGDRNLVVQELSLLEASGVGMSTPERKLYTLNVRLSTGVSSELIGAGPTGECLPPSSVQSGGEYCAIDTFSTVVAVGNTSRE